MSRLERRAARGIGYGGDSLPDRATLRALAERVFRLLTTDIVGPSVALGPRGVLVLTARD
jgi:hypothetical protein